MSKSNFQILNPTIKNLLETIDSFRASHKLENVHFYLKSPKERHEFTYHHQSNHVFVETIGNIKHLIEHLIVYEHHTTSNKTNDKHVLNEKQLLHSFNQIKFLLKADNLIVIKCEQKVFIHFLHSFKSFIDHFNKKTSTFHTIRHLIWIPETNSTKSSKVDTKLTTLISSINKICSNLKVYLLNWYFPLDINLDKIISHGDDDGEFSFGRFSIKLLTSFKYDSSLKNVECDNKSVQLESFIFKQKDYIHSENDHTQQKIQHQRHRPMYRIVSNPIEPFVITSQLDEDFITKNECKDGLLCLDIKSNYMLDDESFADGNDSNNLTMAVRDALNRELTIGLIKGFKYISDFKNGNEDKVRLNEKKLVKYKCCTGYVIFFYKNLFISTAFLPIYHRYTSSIDRLNAS